jgi:hypothetical protein
MKSNYPKGVKPTAAEMKALPLQPHNIHPDWNYTIGLKQKGGIHLTQVTTTYSVVGYGEALGADCGGGLSADIPGVSGLVSQ